jgi:hypothetical protein
VRGLLLGLLSFPGGAAARPFGVVRLSCLSCTPAIAARRRFMSPRPAASLTASSTASMASSISSGRANIWKPLRSQLIATRAES